MCKAFSCIIDQTGKVTWKLGVDSHTALAKLGGYADRVLGEFAKIEITPKNNNYLNPDQWIYKVDQSPTPSWCGIHEKELCLAAHKKWLKKLDKFIDNHSIINPFRLTPPEVIDRKKILLLKAWDSVWASVGDSVWESVGNFVWDYVGASVGESVWDYVGASVGESVWDYVGASVKASGWASVWAYIGSFFKIPVWKYVKHPKGKYPYQALITLWNMGLVPSFDGTTWRLHGGPKGSILFSITKTDLQNYK